MARERPEKERGVDEHMLFWSVDWNYFSSDTKQLIAL